MSKVANLEKQIKDLRDQIIKIQNRCEHPKSKRKIDGPPPNDLSGFSYKIHFCAECEKRWTVTT